jgi:SpoVK/Ycf46/Vps4 family AAA+-type ATPase
MYEAVQRTSFEDLILAGSLKDEIRGDLEQFLRSRSEYARFGVPWKRGILFVGPPGNGKTHCLRACIRLLDVTCMYVQSLKTRHGTEDANMRAVFGRARELTPCCLVFEDIDAMITSENRSFFLNQLDGFEHNDGILTLATTNHPERLDPAMVDRPSRFDRKYNFALPAPRERSAYIEMWNGRLDPEMRVPATATLGRLVEQTEGFSFAYIKELFVSSMVRWMCGPRKGEISPVLFEQLALLRQQMNSERQRHGAADRTTANVAGKKELTSQLRELVAVLSRRFQKSDPMG